MEDDNWVERIGKPTFESLEEMVAALDFESWLETLSKEEIIAKLGDSERFNPDWLKVLTLEELRDEVTEYDLEFDEEEARQRIYEDPLSVQVRSGWHSPGAPPEAPEEYEILLGTGGPATRIVGKLDEHGQPVTAHLQCQDWFKPWTEYQCDEDVLLRYASCFYFWEG
jgi:hypothetical protein